MHKYILVGAACLFILVLGCTTGGDSAKYTLPDTAAAQVVETLPDGPELHVLFLGNSLTNGYGNDVPALVRAMADAGGVKLRYLTHAPGLTSLEDHWQDQCSRQTLARSRWDYVVLQQGPSTTRESQADLKQWAVTWANEIRRHNATPLLYMVQPSQDQRNGFRLVSLSYRGAAQTANAPVAPAGEAWEEAVRAAPDLALYLEDKLHATEAGAYLSALVLTQALTGVRPEQIPDRLALGPKQVLDLPRDVATTLRAAAARVMAPRH